MQALADGDWTTSAQDVKHRCASPRKSIQGALLAVVSLNIVLLRACTCNLSKTVPPGGERQQWRVELPFKPSRLSRWCANPSLPSTCHHPAPCHKNHTGAQVMHRPTWTSGPSARRSMSCSTSLRRMRLPQSAALERQLEAPGRSMPHSQLQSASLMDLTTKVTRLVTCTCFVAPMAAA